MKSALFTLGSIAILWIILTLLAERKGAANTILIGELNSVKRALIVYNPDLFYNLDKQVCTSFANGLLAEGWSAKLATITAAEEMTKDTFDLYVFCANTYNWAPDWPTSRFIERHGNLENKNVLAITLGSGSTNRSQRLLEQKLREKKANIVDSQVFWLMRPNEDASTERSNVKVAVENAYGLGRKTARQLAHE